jgi:hypothetical protein
MSFAAVSAQDEVANLRVVHASPDAPNVDIWVNGEVAISDLAFGEATEYAELEPGDYQIQVTPTGEAADTAVIDATVTLEAGSDYTVAAIGLVEAIDALVLTDDNAAPAEGQAHVRIVHASPDAPAVDVAVTGGPILVENLPFGEASSYIPVDAGTYDLEIRPTGTEDVALAIPGWVATAGDVYTVFAIGLVEDGSLGVLALVDAQYGDSTGGGETEATATTGTAPEATATTGVPDTGAGGMAGDDSSLSMWWLIAGGIAVALVVAIGGRAVLATNRER